MWEVQLPFALESGVSYEEFWHEDIDVVNVKMKAYANRLHRQAHIQGAYVREALVSVLAPMFSESAKSHEYAYPTKSFIENSTQNKISEPKVKVVETNINCDDKIELIGRQAILDCY